MMKIALARTYTKCKMVDMRSKKYRCLTVLNKESLIDTSLKDQYENELRKQKIGGWGGVFF